MRASRRASRIDLDPQGNIARDLGMEPNNGQQLLSALVSGSDLPVVLNVRDKLDVVPGGPEVADLGGLMYSRAARGGGRRSPPRCTPALPALPTTMT